MQKNLPTWLQRVEFSKLDGVKVGCSPNEFGTPDDEARKFERLAQAICGEFEARKGTDRLKWLKQVSYNVALCYIELNLWEVLEARIANCGRYSRGLDPRIDDFGPTMFSQCIMAIFADDLDRNHINETQRRRLSWQMWFGYRHYIPPALLNAFNAGFPLHCTLPDPDWEALDESLYPWIIDQCIAEELCGGNSHDQRFEYPPAITNEVSIELERLRERARRIDLEMQRDDVDGDEYDVPACKDSDEL